MRVKVLSRNPDDCVRETKLDLQRGESGTRRGAGRSGAGRGAGPGPPGTARGTGRREGAQETPALPRPAAERPPGGAEPAASPGALGGLPAAGLGRSAAMVVTVAVRVRPGDPPRPLMCGEAPGGRWGARWGCPLRRPLPRAARRRDPRAAVPGGGVRALAVRGEERS